jgi:hypothetical protein
MVLRSLLVGALLFALLILPEIAVLIFFIFGLNVALHRLRAGVRSLLDHPIDGVFEGFWGRVLVEAEHVHRRLEGEEPP